MHETSDAYKDAIQRSHTVITKVEVLDTDYVLQYILKPTQGNVQVDRSNDIRRSCSVELVDPTGDLTPDDATDLLHPLSSNRLRIFRGIKIPGGEDEIFSLGVFDIFDSNVSDSGDQLTINIQGFDLSKSVARARLLQNYNVPPGENYDLAIRDLLSFQVPTLSFNLPSISHLTPPLVFGSSGESGGGNPWKYATEMAQSVGYDIYFDVQGVVNMTPVPDPEVDHVVWTYDEGELSMLLYVEKKLSKDEVFNHVIVTGENTALDEPVRGEAIDDDVNSPTYYLGPFGNVPTFMHSEYVTTEAQANELAAARLRQVKGLDEGMQVISTPNMAIEVGDIIEVKRARAKINRKYVLEKFNISLNHNVSNNMTLRRVL